MAPRQLRLKLRPSRLASSSAQNGAGLPGSAVDSRGAEPGEWLGSDEQGRDYLLVGAQVYACTAASTSLVCRLAAFNRLRRYRPAGRERPNIVHGHRAKAQH